MAAKSSHFSVHAEKSMLTPHCKETVFPSPLLPDKLFAHAVSIRPGRIALPVYGTSPNRSQ
jgi:hypothetical protein